MEGKTINMIQISEDRTIAVLELDFENKKIKFRNLGELFEIKIIENRYFYITEDGFIHVLLPSGTSQFKFHLTSLNPYHGVKLNLIENENIKRN